MTLGIVPRDKPNKIVIFSLDVNTRRAPTILESTTLVPAQNTNNVTEVSYQRDWLDILLVSSYQLL